MKKRILVVDDDRVVVHLLNAILRSNGYEVIVAYDGIDAMVAFKNEKVDLVLLDIELPEMNGYDICYQLRFNEIYKKIPIILLTVRVQELHDNISNRVDIEYVPKPIVTKDLLEKVRTIFSKEE